MGRPSIKELQQQLAEAEAALEAANANAARYDRLVELAWQVVHPTPGFKVSDVLRAHDELEALLKELGGGVQE